MKILLWLTILMSLVLSCSKMEEAFCYLNTCIDWTDYTSTATLNDLPWSANFAYFQIRADKSVFISLNSTTDAFELRDKIQINYRRFITGKQELFFQGRATLPELPTSYFDRFVGDGDAVYESYDLINDQHNNTQHWVNITEISIDSTIIEGTYELSYTASEFGPNLANYENDSLTFHQGKFKAYRIE